MLCRLVRQRSGSGCGVPDLLIFTLCQLSSPRAIHQQETADFPRARARGAGEDEGGDVIADPCSPPASSVDMKVKQQHLIQPYRPSLPLELEMEMLVDIITSGGGCLDDMEASIERLGLVLTPALVAQAIRSCRASSAAGSSSSRRLLRFFSWCRHKCREEFGDEIFNHAIQTFADMKDFTAMGIVVSDLQKEGRKMDPETFVRVAETLIRSGRTREAVRLFCYMEMEEAGGGGGGKKPLLPRPRESDGVWSSVIAIIHALCEKGHVREAQRVLWRHKDKLVEAEQRCIIVHQSLLHGWCVHGNAREARRVMDEMKSLGISPGLASYNDFLRCICKRNLKFNPSALVPEAINVLTEMRRSGVPPTAISFNILLSCLGRSRRVKEACRILVSMIHGNARCSPDWVSYYLVTRVLYLTRRFVRGHRVMDWMIEEGVMPPARYYHGLIGILLGMEEVDHALQVFQRMKRCCCGQNNGPTYDLLIAKLCRCGKFDKGRSLWNKAVDKGISLRCSSHLLDPSKTAVFKPLKAAVNLNKV